jgi:hypothetical protein
MKPKIIYAVLLLFIAMTVSAQKKSALLIYRQALMNLLLCIFQIPPL